MFIFHGARRCSEAEGQWMRNTSSIGSMHYSNIQTPRYEKKEASISLTDKGVRRGSFRTHGRVGVKETYSVRAVIVFAMVQQRGTALFHVTASESLHAIIISSSSRASGAAAAVTSSRAPYAATRISCTPLPLSILSLSAPLPFFVC